MARCPSPTRRSEREPLGDWAKLADPTRIARGSRNRYAEIQRDPPLPPSLIRVVSLMIASSLRFTGRRVYLTTLAVWTQRWHGLARCNAPGFPLYSDPLHKAASGTTCETRRSWPRRSSRSELASCVIVGASARERPSKRQASVDAQAATCSLDLRLA